ncbi:MAG TPA: FAD binding domain-containing protein [Burkholderiales bacterium]|nr:FAD binding domain-containing protein [Burkholderiales bacterium]
MGSYYRPRALDDALRARAGGRCVVLAGGTDFYPARVGRTVEEDVLDITALAELRGVREEATRFRIGALTTWTDLLEAPLPAWFGAVKLAAREVGGVQIQNAGTVAGNLCNASPAADGVPPLLALGAEVELRSVRGTRTLPLGDFIQGNRKTGRAADELLTAVLVTKWADGVRSTFLKLGARRYLVISIAMVAAVVETDARGAIARCGVAVGACSAVAQRLPALEGALAGRPLARGIGAAVRPEHLAPLAPITDVRATAAYRGDAVATLVSRALESLACEQLS